MIDTYLSYRDSTSWLLDTRYNSHMCSDSRRLTSKQKLRKGEVELRIGNDARVAIVLLGVVNLKLPFSDYLSLKEFYYIPDIVKNIILVSFLDKMGYILIIKDKCKKKIGDCKKKHQSYIKPLTKCVVAINLLPK